jgi:glycosidase
MRRIFAAAAILVVACSSTASGPSEPAAPTLPTHPTAEQQAAADGLITGHDWYRHAVFYEVNVRSFSDSNSDGIGDLPGLTSKLDYLKDLGIDALWLMPVYPTPFVDSGYDIADYRAVNPDYGTMADFEELVRQAHARKMRVFMDLVLNHTSDQHAWFQQSRADKTNPKADWYVWSDTAGRADIGNCNSGQPTVFGPSWTLDAPRNQYFFHRYYPGQPDLDYRNPAVAAEMLDVARFWLKDEGVDGYRCDAVGQIFESPAACVMIPETVAYIQKLRGVIDETPDKAMVAEPSDLSNSTPYYGDGSNMFNMTFEFAYGYFWGLSFAAGDKTIIEKSINNTTGYPKGAQPGQVIGSHDVARAYQAAGGDEWKARNAALLSMTMKGTPFVYYGDEVGLRPGTAVVVDSRDSARTPMTWKSSDPGFGFTTGKPWIAFGDAAAQTSVDAEDADPASMLTYYRALLAFRRGHAVWGTGDIRLVETDSSQLVAFVRENEAEQYLVVVNLTEDEQTGASAAPIPAGKLVLGSATISGNTVKIPGRGAAVFKVR